MFRLSGGIYALFLWLTGTLMLVQDPCFAQKEVRITDSEEEHRLLYNEIEYLEDKNASLTINAIREPAWSKLFKPTPEHTFKNYHTKSIYWLRLKINADNLSEKRWILEFFDQTIDEITVFVPDNNGHFSVKNMGDKYPFKFRNFSHKNFTVNINPDAGRNKIYYVRLRSHEISNIIIYLRSLNRFIAYGLYEYFFFGIFYGMILVFSLYNFMMYLAFRQKQYLYYVAYNISVSLYQLCTEGLAYQFLWPSFPVWNQYAYGIALFFVSISILLFSQSILQLRKNAPKLYQLINWTIVLRTLYFLICLVFKNDWFIYKIVEIVPLLVCYYCGCYSLYKKYPPAKYIVIGYSFLLAGFFIKLFRALELEWLPHSLFIYYSLSFGFVMEMIFLSFAIGERVRVLKIEKEKAQRHTIEQMQQNEKLQKIINQELEEQIRARTKEIIEKSEIIDKQNKELTERNQLLKEQSEEISLMLVLLEQDNQSLQTDIEKVTRDRVMSKEVDFAEFSRVYPDKETCLKYLADLKWSKGYVCLKCGNKEFYPGSFHSRRCTKCAYEESAAMNTMLENVRIPINKAFYIIFLVYSSGGKISSYKLSELLSIRQGTCWTYGSRIKKLMQERKKEIRNMGEEGWSKLLLENITR